MRMIIKLRIHA